MKWGFELGWGWVGIRAAFGLSIYSTLNTPGNRSIREGYGVCGHAGSWGQLGGGGERMSKSQGKAQRVLAAGVWGEKAAGQSSPG